VEVLVERLCVDGRRRDDDAQVGPAAPHFLQQPKENFSGHSSLVRLVHHDHAVPATRVNKRLRDNPQSKAKPARALGEQRVLHQLAQQQPVRAELNPGLHRMRLIVKPHRVSHALPQLHPQLVRHTLRYSNRGHAARLRHDAHAPALAPARLLHVLRYLRRLAAAS